MDRGPDFFSTDNVVAVVGVSADSSKWGTRVYKHMLKDGFKCYPVGRIEEMDGDKVYSGLSAVPELPDMAIIVVPPKIALSVVKECAELGIKKVWFQPGSESEKAASICEENGIDFVQYACYVVDGQKHDW